MNLDRTLVLVEGGSQQAPNGQYYCQPRVARGGCGRITVDQRQLDRHVGALVVRILVDPRHTEAIEAAAKATQDKRRPLRAELTECEHLADELSGRLGRREITLQRYDVAMAPLDKRIAELHAERAELGTACRQQPRTRPSRPRPVRNGRRDGTLPR